MTAPMVAAETATEVVAAQHAAHNSTNPPQQQAEDDIDAPPPTGWTKFSFEFGFGTTEDGQRNENAGCDNIETEANVKSVVAEVNDPDPPWEVFSYLGQQIVEREWEMIQQNGSS